ncbi:MAG: hypothetical protein L0Y66_15935 [Myxococcaceae bacterium]|nr:hypothetical protein [Myxococcaceae bacterium]MCI0673094.1 hypothetical protein [Myxococcaceae bacterium]
MEQELERFRQEVARLQEGVVRSSVRYPEALRQFAVRYVAEAKARGDSQEKACARLGISAPTVAAWRTGHTQRSRHAARPEGTAEKLVSVVVRPTADATPRPGEASSVVVVAPNGWRVEGLGVEAAAALLKSLSC